MKSGAKFSCGIKCVETFKADYEVCRKRGISKAIKSFRRDVGV